VEIFWRNVWNYTSTSNFSTFNCLSSKSKEILYKNGIIISTPTSQQFISSQNLNNSRKTVAQEVFKLFLKQYSTFFKKN